MIGKTLSHYEILEKLGEGGMGVVYKARDLRLDRPVALKFLPQHRSAGKDDKNRLMLEAQTTSALNHPNISHIYEIDDVDGETFIAMEFVDGRNLRQTINNGPMQIERTVAIALQISRGLQQAHAKGIVHRDIKPENILETNDGVVKILDFGIACMVQPADSASTSVYGSIAYMSPEQLRHESITLQTDIWSLGVVLYEMLTGRLPFRGEYEQMISYSVANEQHAPVTTFRADVPLPLERLIDRCLDKSPALRFRDMEEVIDALKRIEVTPARPKETTKSIAVLPFADISTDEENRYFGDGLTEEIISNLSKLRMLKVVSLASVMQYDRGTKSLRQSAVDLGVQYLLEGSVRKHGSDLRITAQLTDATQDSYLWAKTYRGSLEDVFDIQEKVAARIARALKVRLTPDEKRTLKKRFTANTEAYQLYLQGRYFWNKRNESELKTAIRYFERAIEKDPGYALAWAGIADSYSLLGEYGTISRKDVYPKAQAAANRALEIDDQLAEVHTSLASLFMLNKWDWETSEKEFKRAIALNPNYATARHWYSQWLMTMGRMEESLREIAKAVELDPISQAIVKDVGLAYYYTRRYDDALEMAKRTMDLDPNYAGAYRLLSLAYQGKQMFDDAIRENERWGNVTKNQSETRMSLAQLYAASGRAREARDLARIIESGDLLSDNVNRGLALVYAALGERDTAFHWLERSFERREEALLSIKVDPKIDNLRSDPRLLALLKKIGIEK